VKSEFKQGMFIEGEISGIESKNIEVTYDTSKLMN